MEFIKPKLVNAPGLSVGQDDGPANNLGSHKGKAIVAGMKRRDEDLFDIGLEALPVKTSLFMA